MLSAGWASAHGSGFQLTRFAAAGPYQLLLGTIPDPPLVGDAILILEVADTDTGERAPNVRVSALTKGPDGASGSAAFGPDSYDPTLYEARAALGAEGKWTFTIEVSGDAGAGSAQFDYDVKRASPVAGIITLATMLALVTVIGLSMRAFLKGRGDSQRARRRKAQPKSRGRSARSEKTLGRRSR